MDENALPEGQLETVITYLEMRAPPGHAHLSPAAKGLAFLKAEHPTLSFYRYLYETVGAPWLWYERRGLSDDALAAIITDDAVDISVLYVGGVPAGYVELDRRDPADIELAYLGLIPDFIGRGLGAFLLNQAIESAWTHEPHRLWLHSCTFDHPKALAIYQRTGFVPYRQEIVRFDDPRLSGLMPAEAGHGL